MEQHATHSADPVFELGPEIGSGAIATVYRISERGSGRQFAGKVLHRRHDRDDAASSRFRRESELATALKHQNLVQVHGIYEIAGRSTLLMELVEGINLAEHLARVGPLDEPTVVAIATGVASGLAYAHSNGVIHRDLKPANILLATTPQGQLVPKIADFGMARAASFANADRKALTVLGTPQYMAPECLDPLAVDPRTDLYALGCIIFEMATGVPPYSGPTPFSTLEAHRTAPIPKLSDEYSTGLKNLLAKLLAKTPGDRPQSASSLVDALTSVAHQTSASESAAVAIASAIAPVGHNAAGGSCAGCGADVMQDVRICFQCGLILVALDPGPYSVFVIGPGKPTTKLDSQLRSKLLQWLEANAAVGFGVELLKRRIPRLPFTLVTGVGQTAAQTLIMSLHRLGLQAKVERGGRFANPNASQAVLRITGRKLSIVAAVLGAPGFFYAPFLLGAGLFVALLFPLFYTWTLLRHTKAMVENVAKQRQSLPDQLQRRIDELHKVVPKLTRIRHRQALRGVIHRTVSLARSTPRPEHGQVDPELSHAVNLATVACQRMDELDTQMSDARFDPTDPHHRSLMKERDTWSARLLDLTATLDSLCARRAAAESRNASISATDMIESLRTTVESLEEVEHL